MFKNLIDLLIEISDKINFATIINFEISQIKVVDINYCNLFIHNNIINKNKLSK